MDHVVNGYALGRHQEHDPRSKAYPAARAVALRDVTWDYHGQVLDQGHLGSCTGHAAVEVLMCGPYYDHGQKVYTEDDAVAVYSEATHLDRVPGFYPPTDTGSSGLAVMKACRKNGWIGGYHHAFGIIHALQALQLGPVITGVPWFDGMFHPDGNGRVIPSGPVAGGHEFLVLGYTNGVGDGAAMVECLNSWGADWGQAGRFKLSVGDWAALLHQGGDVTVPVT